MKKKTEHDVGAAETSAVPDVSTPAAPPAAGSAIEPMGVDAIRSRILTVRGVQVMLDRDLAELYGVPTKRLNEQVKRNVRRFPESFMFQLAKEELED
ncbi:MAG: ORF6N domain-containing protein [Kiritimatiellae bacterium]|nr:ORF6N domain-containing protein [Kiritimatiellia bacterium]